MVAAPRKALARAPGVLLGLALIYVACLGVISTDFGRHWDEYMITGSVQKSFESGLLLPRWYNYPSVSYDVGVLVALPHFAADALGHFDLSNPGPGSPALVSYLGSPGFNLELRAVFFLLCALTGLAVYLLALRLSGHAWTALFAALAAVSSWEFVYHARWIAPDGLVMLFAAFSLWAQHRILDPAEAERRRAWVLRASVFAGLATGAKYTGGIMVLPLLLAIGFAPRSAGHGRTGAIRNAGLALLVVAATFVLSSPGCVLEPMVFLRGVVGEMFHYQLGHGGNTVGAGLPHLSLLATYLGTVLLSENPVLAASLASLAVAGALALARTQGRVAIWLLSMPILFVAYISTQRVMLVRNYLILLPLMAVLAGLGLSWLLRAASERTPLRRAVGAAALAYLVFNLLVATRSAWSIASPSRVTQKQALEKRLASASRTKFFLSPASRALLEEPPAFAAANVVGAMDSSDRFVFVSDEIKDLTQFAANKRGRYRTVWKRMDEVNWDYYPNWIGSPRVLEVSARALKAN